MNVNKIHYNFENTKLIILRLVSKTCLVNSLEILSSYCDYKLSRFENKVRIPILKGEGQKIDARNHKAKGSTKYIFYQIFSPSDTWEDSKLVFEKSSNPLRL